VALGQVFSEYFGFPCQFSFHDCYTFIIIIIIIITGWYNMPISGRRTKWTVLPHPQETIKKKTSATLLIFNSKILEKLGAPPLTIDGQSPSLFHLHLFHLQPS
jgi:hypothetical protein